MILVWDILGYLGIFFGSIYRLPQIIKIYKTKKGDDVSKKTFILQSLAYICLLLYVSTKEPIDYLLLGYYVLGTFLNLLIIVMKRYYKQNHQVDSGSIEVGF